MIARDSSRAGSKPMLGSNTPYARRRLLRSRNDCELRHRRRGRCLGKTGPPKYLDECLHLVDVHARDRRPNLRRVEAFEISLWIVGTGWYPWPQAVKRQDISAPAQKLPPICERRLRFEQGPQQVPIRDNVERSVWKIWRDGITGEKSGVEP